jgi:hypothetical protein
MAVLLVALSVLGIADWASKVFPPQPVISSAASGSNPVSAGVMTRPMLPAPVAPTAGTIGGPTHAIPPSKEEQEEFVRRRTAELNELAMQNSPEAHQQIVDELKNPAPEIRKAALEALKQARDRSVIPQMQEMAGQTDDSTEKQAILDAIDFINLPSLTEHLNQQQKN